MISLGSITICVFASVALVLHICVILRQKSIFIGGIKFVFIGIAVILLRLLVPINFPYRIDVPIPWVMPDVQMFLQQEIFGKVQVSTIILGIFGAGACISISLKIMHYIKARRLLAQVINITGSDITEKVKTFLSSKEAARVRVAMVYGRKDIIPFITGFLRPVLVLPDRVFADQELSFIVRHETEHARNKDLWLKALIEILLSIYWWNPFIYILRKKLYLVLEVSDDIMTTRKMDAWEKASYAEFLCRAAADYTEKKQVQGLSLFHEKKDLQIRINTILNCDYSKIRKMGSAFFNLGFAAVTAAICFTFVPEACRIPEDIEKTSFSIDEDNAYLVETEEGYELYVNDTYMGELSDIPDALRLKIYSDKEKEDVNEN